MAKDPIVFAMANPIPEIMPEDAAGHVAVMATGQKRLSEPDQQCSVLSRHLSRRVELPRFANQRSNEARRRQRHRRHHRRRRTSSRLHYPFASSTVASAKPSPKKSKKPPTKAALRRRERTDFRQRILTLGAQASACPFERSKNGNA